jgi:hypothetical protein
VNSYFKKSINWHGFLAAHRLLIICCISILPINVLAESGTSAENSNTSSSSANDRTIGRVVKTIRTAVLIDKQNDQSIQVKRRGERLFSGNELHTGLNSKAYIKMGDGSKILLRPNSKLRLTDRRKVNVDRGRIMFSVAKRSKTQNPFMVATRVALLGIRGTQFVVEAGEDDESFNVYLKEGSIVAYPQNEQFKLYKEKQKQDFSDYVNNQADAFEKMKAQRQQEFAEYVEEINMKKNKGLSFSGNDVKEVEIPEEVKAWFDEFDDPDIGW